MNDKTIMQVTHRLYQTILTPDINTGNTTHAPNTGTSKTSIMTRVNNNLTPTSNINQESSTVCQFPKHASLDPPNKDPYQNVAHTKINCLP